MEFSSEKAQSFYYSAHHLARDLFWNAGNFAFFMLLAAFADTSIRATIWSFMLNAAQLDSAVIQTAICLVCLALGAVAGLVANQVYVAVVDLLPDAWIRSITYDGFYAVDRERIRDLYSRVFGQQSDLLLRPNHREMDLIVRLTGFMRLYNPSGYVHVFRTYSIVSLFRQGILYSLLLCAWSLINEAWVAAAVILVAILILFLALHRSLAQSGTREYAFILATLQWLEQQRSLKEQTMESAANPALAPDG